MNNKKTTSVKVLVDTVKKVQKFNAIANKCNFNFDIVCGRYIVDGKSLMGMLSLDLEQSVSLVFDNALAEIIDSAFSTFIIKD